MVRRIGRTVERVIKKSAVIIVSGIAVENAISRKYASDYSVIREILINVSEMFNITSLHVSTCVEHTKAVNPHYTTYIFPLRSRWSQYGRPWLRRRFVAGLVSRRPGFSSWPFRVGFVVHKVGPEQVFFRALFPLARGGAVG